MLTLVMTTLPCISQANLEDGRPEHVAGGDGMSMFKRHDLLWYQLPCTCYIYVQSWFTRLTQDPLQHTLRMEGLRLLIEVKG